MSDSWREAHGPVSDWTGGAGARSAGGAAGGEAPQSLADVPGSIADKLEIARKDLLDLGLRNSLLNYRLLRARGVEIVNEWSSEVLRILVHEGKAMSFVPAPDKPSGEELAQPDGQEDGQVAAQHTDLHLQTSDASQKLQARLLATYYAAHTSIEEQGVNTLFLALGMLHWHEAQDSTLRKAPLLLVPVELNRSNARERFKVRYSGEEMGGNLSLEEKLRREFAITLPGMPDIEDLDVDQYLGAVAEAVRSQPDWAVGPNEIALGFFSFAKLLMFKDLEAERWPANAQPSSHSIVRALLGDGFREAPSSYGEADHLDRRQEALQLSPVMDADSSQTLAILDVKSGRNMVIQGPPGTGKSQTITNVIAEAIAQDKTVLFVAEKLAALQVVKRRLDRTGLGDAALELHSHTTQKKALLGELRRTLELGEPRESEGTGERDQLGETRERLNAYCEAVNTAVHQSGITPYRALGEVVQLEQRLGSDALQRLPLAGATSWGDTRFRKLLATVEDLQARLGESGVPREHPFRGSRRTAFTRIDAPQLRARLEAAQQAIAGAEQAGRELARTVGASDPTNGSEVEDLYPPAWKFWRSWFGKDKAARAAAREALQQQRVCMHAVLEFLDVDEDAVFGAATPLSAQTFEKQRYIVEFWRQHVDELRTLAAVNEAIDACRREGLGSVIDRAETWPGACNHLGDAFRYSYLSDLLEAAYAERPPLSRFHRESHERILSEFRRLDRLLTHYNSARLAREHWQRLPALHNGGGQLAVLKHEFEKKTRHMPIRHLMVKAGRPIQAMKPVFMMSPLSIANYLPPDSLTFDLVIFDEASQVKPVDAFGAILRGRQAVVVGDSKQLPPTSFFDALTGGDEEDEEIATSDIESVLGLFSAQLAPERMLRWHYRSRHESLIAVSNHAFYNDRLVVFPSPDAARLDSGLICHNLPESNYDRGGTRSNQIEAEIVARAVMEHARTRPDLSLGVAAFSVAQMKAIQDQLEILRRQDPSGEEFFMSAHPHEHFFVKNLETVQGDERDVIFISVGYGRTRDGYLSMSFGPLNGDGGERRLNVLITRARVRCEVFTNLRADDIQAEGKGPGVGALKMFLHYAETGNLDVPRPAGAEADSPFEEAVYDELTRHGFTVHQQVGSAGFHIDLAVVDPDAPGRYLLGIECDGAAYHSARSARDRDRLRQAVLEGLGWRIHRIWSTDWYQQPGPELQRLLAAVEQARIARASVAARPEPEIPAATPAIVREQTPRLAEEDPPTPPYRMAQLSVDTRGVELHAVPVSALADCICRVVEVESPVHIDEVMHRVAEAAGVKRVGSRIDAAMRGAAASAARRGMIRQDGDFLWSVNSRGVQVRDRSSLPATSRRLEHVAPAELRAAVLKATEAAYGIGIDEIPGAVGHLLGFNRVSEDMRSRVELYAQTLLREGSLVQQGDYVARAAKGRAS